MKRILPFLALLFIAPFVLAQTEIKFATVAPEGTSWMKIMRQIAKEVGDQTHNQVTFKFYPGGVMGDETEMLRKIRIGQLHSGGFTGNGLGEVNSAIRVLELPYLFQSEEEIDTAVAAIQDDLERGFAEKGFVLLGWADVGFVHFFSKGPIRNSSDLNGKKVWMWQGDPLARAFFKSYNVNAIPLALQDVLTQLQTGMIDVVYASPAAAIGLQWQTRTKYVTEQPMTYASGAVLLSKKSYDKLTADQQNILKNVSRRLLRQLTIQSRKDNKAAFATLKASGLSVTPIPSESELKHMEEISLRTRQQLVGQLYSQSMLTKVESALKAYREKN